MTRSTALALLLPCAALCAALLSMRFGAVSLPVSSVFEMVFGGSSAEATLVQRYRLPRTLIALLAGSNLAVSGLLLQTALRNSLADPTIFGISGGAALALVATMTISVAVANPDARAIVPTEYLPGTLIAPIALLGALAATAGVLALAWEGGLDPRRTALTGVIFGAVLSAATMGCILTLPEAQTQFAILWLAGSLYARDMAHVWTILPWAIAGLAASALVMRPLGLLRFDATTAASLGLPVQATRVTAVVLASTLAASAVSVAGPVGFVGLLVPHAVRAAGITEPMAQLWGCIWVGGILVVLADVLGRTLAVPLEVPVGICTSLLGAPLLAALLLRKEAAR
ncbi:MAG: iron ABC transporter permease [Pseudomonadota bacterium]